MDSEKCSYPDSYPAESKGPCRETAVSMLQRELAQLDKRRSGLEHLLRIAEKVDPGSPLEESLWELFHGGLYGRR